MIGTGPQRLDSVVRTVTASALALILVSGVVYLAIAQPTSMLSGVQAVLAGWAGVVIGFYFGGHVAQNTAALEEARQVKATSSAEASAVRAEAASTPDKPKERP